MKYQSIEDNQKAILLQRQLGMVSDENYTRCLGAIKMPPGYALMRCNKGYYFLKWDGEVSVCDPNKYIPVKWARDNYNWDTRAA